MSKRKTEEFQSIPTSEDERDIYYQDRAQDAWQRFIQNNQPAALAEYLKYDGEVDARVRKALIDILKDHPGGNPGGSKPFRDLQTYVLVENMCKVDSLRNAFAKMEGSPSGKPLTKRQALLRYSEMTRQDLRAVETQYSRGKRINKQNQ